MTWSLRRALCTMQSMDSEFSNLPRYQQRRSCRSTVLVLLLVVAMNTASVLLFSGAGAGSLLAIRFGGHCPSVPACSTANKLLRELNATEYALGASRAELVELRNSLAAASSLVETLLGDSTADAPDTSDASEEAAAHGLWRGELSGELKLAVGPHKLPLGFMRNLGSDEMFPAVGQACHRFQRELEQYMEYTPGGECPSDQQFEQRLMLKGCEPLPRRRCRPRSPAGYADPAPLPASLWATPPDTSVVWDAYTCKNYSCLVNRGKSTKGFYDCKDCFDVRGSRQRARWTRDGALDYSVDAVLAARPNGTVRVGLDIGGGVGTFAARMLERGVTVVTTSMNFDGPFNSFVASRGLVPMHISVARRLPFFDGTLDVVHSMHVLSHWIPEAVLEFALFDVYRVLRPGGLFWLDRFFCLGPQLNATYVPMFERIGFKKLRWNVGRKLDRGIEMNEWYLSALLERPKG